MTEENIWLLGNLQQNQSFHIQVKSGKERIRRLLPHHLSNFPWLAVSRVDGVQGAFCVPCVLFMSTHGHGVGGRSHGHGQVAGRLVSRPLDRFDDLTGKSGSLSLHETKDYHKSCLIAMDNFQLVNNRKQDDVLSQIDF